MPAARSRFPAYVIGQEFYAGRTVLTKQVVFEDAMRYLGDRVEIKPERYAVDRTLARHLLRPGKRRFPGQRRLVVAAVARSTSWCSRASEIYVLPWGTKIRLEKQPGGTAWRLIASRADGILCHKPCTVSGGGKSEISKSLAQHHPERDRSLSAITKTISSTWQKF